MRESMEVGGHTSAFPGQGQVNLSSMWPAHSALSTLFFEDLIVESSSDLVSVFINAEMLAVKCEAQTSAPTAASSSTPSKESPDSGSLRNRQ